MATFGSFGAGLASGLEQHRQFGERQQEFAQGRTDKRIERGIQLVEKLSGLIEANPQLKGSLGDSLTSAVNFVSQLTGNDAWRDVAKGTLEAPTPQVVGEQIIFVDQTLDPARQMSESLAVLSTDVEGLRVARSDPNLREIEKYEIPEVTEAKVDPNRYKVVNNRLFDVVETIYVTDAPTEKVTAAEFKQVPGVGFVHLATQKIIFGPEETVDWDRYRNVSDGIFDLQEGIWKSPPTKKYDHLRNVAGGIYDVEQLGWVVSPKKEHNVLDVQGGIFDLDARAWLVEPPEKFDHIKTVKDGIWNARVGRWEVEPSKSWSHLKVVDGGVFDPSANDGNGVWLVPKSEKGLWTYEAHPRDVKSVIAISPEGQRSVQPKASLTLAEKSVYEAEAKFAGEQATAVDTAVLGAEAEVAAEEVTQERRLAIKRAADLFDAETASLLAPIKGETAAAEARAEFESKVENGDFSSMATIEAMKEIIKHRAQMAAGMGWSEPIRMENGQYMQVSEKGKMSVYGPVTAGKVRYEVTETEGLVKEIQPDGKESLVWMDPKAKALFEAKTKVETEDILAEGRLDRAALEGEIKAAMTFAEWDALEAGVDGLTRRDILRQKGYIKDDAERAMRAAADGYLYYVDTKERVYPDIRKDRKAYSAIVLFNPNAKEGEPRWDAFNRNEDQNVINRQIEAGWIPTSISIAAENVEGLLTDRQIVEEFKGLDDSAEALAEIGSLFRDVDELGRGAVGLGGKLTENFAKMVGWISPNWEESIVQRITGEDTDKFYNFRADLKRLSMNLVKVFTGEEEGRYTDTERRMSEQAASINVDLASVSAVRATLRSLYTLHLIAKMRNQYSLHRNNPDIPFNMDVLNSDNLQTVAAEILDATGFRENGDDRTVTKREKEMVARIIKDLVEFQKLAGFKSIGQ